MLFAHFYHNSTGYVEDSIPPIFKPENVKPVPVCGSNGYFYLDGRLNLNNAIAKAMQVCKQRKFKGFTIHKGKSVLNEKPLTKLILVSD